MIQEAYVSFEVAKLLKEKGFPQIKLLGHFITEMVYSINTDNNGKHHFVRSYSERIYNKDKYIAAPTHQMAMAWLMEKNIIITVIPKWFNVDNKCTGWNYQLTIDGNYEDEFGTFGSYEEAVETALKYVLEDFL